MIYTQEAKHVLCLPRVRLCERLCPNSIALEAPPKEAELLIALASWTRPGRVLDAGVASEDKSGAGGWDPKHSQAFSEEDGGEETSVPVL